MTISIDYGLTPTRVGRTVTFRVVVDDPDAEVLNCVTIERYGDDTPARSCTPPVCPPQHGTWTPVARPGHLERTFQHAYSRPGTYAATFGFTSMSCGGPLVFGNQGSIDATVVVGP